MGRVVLGMLVHCKCTSSDDGEPRRVGHGCYCKCKTIRRPRAPAWSDSVWAWSMFIAAGQTMAGCASELPWSDWLWACMFIAKSKDQMIAAAQVNCFGIIRLGHGRRMAVRAGGFFGACGSGHIYWVQVPLLIGTPDSGNITVLGGRMF